MEQISKRDGKYFYGQQQCKSIDDAYGRFRDEYHKSLGRDATRRLNQLGQRSERLHGYGFVFPDEVQPNERFRVRGTTCCYILGLIGISYVRTIGIWDYGDVPDEDFDAWLDFVYRRGNRGLRTLGKGDKVGRTSTRLKKRYR